MIPRSLSSCEENAAVDLLIVDDGGRPYWKAQILERYCLGSRRPKMNQVDGLEKVGNRGAKGHFPGSMRVEVVGKYAGKRW